MTPPFAADRMTGGAGSRGALEEQILAALGITCRDLHFVFTDAGHLVNAPSRVTASFK
jgi:hypothetical protein